MNMNPSLQLYRNGQIIFSSEGKWLYPLFELHTFLTENGIQDRSSLIVKDKIIGKAAALILVYLKLDTIEGYTLSVPAEKVLIKFNRRYTYRKLIDRIHCKTEDLLMHEWDPLKAWQIIQKRIEDQPQSQVKKQG
ncbi:MAG: DUF1893 domain-containing protein [Caldithrix sp.]|nr:DUF1893 domain-containing protein [Caldithrix sp.]